MSDQPIHVAIKHPRQANAETTSEGDVAFMFRGKDGSRLDVILTRAQAMEMIRGPHARPPRTPIAEAAWLYATDEINAAELEQRVAAALEAR